MEGAAKPLRTEHSEATRAAIVASARALFAERGYARVSIEDIVRQARVTRGALYHHFRDKRELFAVVYEEVERDLTERIAAALSEQRGDPVEVLRRGTNEFLDLCMEPEMQRIGVIDATAVLGWRERHQVAERYALALIRAGLTMVAEAGRLRATRLEPLTHLLHGAMFEASTVIAESEDPERARVEMGQALDELTDSLVTPSGTSG